jgi:hypothetical protein
MFHGLMYLVIGMRSIRPWAQKVVIGPHFFLKLLSIVNFTQYALQFIWVKMA